MANMRSLHARHAYDALSTLDKRLWLRRDDLGLSVVEAAAQAGVSEHVWRRAEDGNHVGLRMENVLKLLRWLAET